MKRKRGSFTVGKNMVDEVEGAAGRFKRRNRQVAGNRYTPNGIIIAFS